MTGARIKELRNELGISQAELAKRMSVSQQTIGSWETGRSEPNLDALKKLAGIFDTSVDYIIGSSKKRHYYELSDKDKKDAAEQVESVISGMTGDINFYGEPMTDEGRAKLKASLQMALELAKQEAKKKFTPKKYRDGE